MFYYPAKPRVLDDLRRKLQFQAQMATDKQKG